MSDRWGWFRDTYLSVDPRSMGVFRVTFGFVLFADLIRRWLEIGLWYTNSGLLPNHTLLWRPPATHMFSLFFTISNGPEAAFGFALCALVYAAFTLGYRTGWAQVLTLVARISLNGRLAVLENGGDMVMDLLCLLTLPLPLGQRFSLDAVVRGRVEPVATNRAGANPVAAGSTRPFVSVAVLGLLLQFSAIYFFNAASKSGAAWRDGTAVHYALHQDKLVTWAGVWLREHVPLPALRVLTRSVLATEWLGCALIMTPFFVRQARLLAVCLMPLLHLGFALGLNLGGFSVAMMSFFPLLLGGAHWDLLSRRFGAPARFVAAAIERAARVLVKEAPLQPPARPWFLRRLLIECAVVVVLLGIASEALNDNTSVPVALRVPRASWTQAIIDYPRVLQGWRMFAPEPPRGDSMIYVDATTAAGRHVDPYNEVASDQAYPAGETVPTHLGQSQFFVMYSERIPNAGYAAYRQAFSEWLEAYPLRTGHPADCLLTYDVYLITDTSPAPGTKGHATPLERQRFMSYSAPAEGTCRPLPTVAAPPTSIAAAH